MGRRPDGENRGEPRRSKPMSRYVRAAAWAVVAVLILALVGSLVLEGFA